MTTPAFIFLSQPQSNSKSFRECSMDSDQELITKMCLEDDEIPDTPGVWWKDDSNWVQYDDQNSEDILTAREVGVRTIMINRTESSRSSSSSGSGSRCSVGSPEYEVDLIKMKEVHLKSGRERCIKIVKLPLKEWIFCTYSISNDPWAKFSIDSKPSLRNSHQKTNEGELYRVSWKHEAGIWCLYNHDCRRTIWSAWTKGDHLVYIENVISEKYPSGVKYMIDTMAMQQTNVITGSKRPVQIALCISSSSSSLKQICYENRSKYLNKEMGAPRMRENEIMLYQLVLSRLVDKEYVKRAISKSIEPHKLQAMDMKIHLTVVENEFWDRFLQSFMETLRNMPEYRGHMWRFALNPQGPHDPSNPFAPTSSNVLWRFVFHAISDSGGHDSLVLFKSGITTSSTKYGACGGWFGLSSTITELHCKPVSQTVVSMLVFLVIMPQNFDTSREKVVFINKTKDHLPVASITLSIDDSTLGPPCSLWEDMNEEETTASSSWRADHVIGHASSYPMKEYNYPMLISSIDPHATTRSSGRLKLWKAGKKSNLHV